MPEHAVEGGGELGQLVVGLTDIEAVVEVVFAPLGGLGSHPADRTQCPSDDQPGRDHHQEEGGTGIDQRGTQRPRGRMLIRLERDGRYHGSRTFPAPVPPGRRAGGHRPPGVIGGYLLGPPASESASRCSEGGPDGRSTARLPLKTQSWVSGATRSGLSWTCTEPLLHGESLEGRRGSRLQDPVGIGVQVGAQEQVEPDGRRGRPSTRRQRPG